MARHVADLLATIDAWGEAGASPRGAALARPAARLVQVRGHPTGCRRPASTTTACARAASPSGRGDGRRAATRDARVPRPALRTLAPAAAIGGVSRALDRLAAALPGPRSVPAVRRARRLDGGQEARSPWSGSGASWAVAALRADAAPVGQSSRVRPGAPRRWPRARVPSAGRPRRRRSRRASRARPAGRSGRAGRGRCGFEDAGTCVRKGRAARGRKPRNPARTLAHVARLSDPGAGGQPAETVRDVPLAPLPPEYWYRYWPARRPGRRQLK